MYSYLVVFLRLRAGSTLSFFGVAFLPVVEVFVGVFFVLVIFVGVFLGAVTVALPKDSVADLFADGLSSSAPLFCCWAIRLIFEWWASVNCALARMNDPLASSLFLFSGRSWLDEIESEAELENDNDIDCVNEFE